jgi:ABC-type multidrug transport system ATPase subunit
LTFSVPRGECFGLLGVNGAGKTTTFKMLTTDFRPSGGNIYMRNNNDNEKFINILEQPKLYTKEIGYCPQFDVNIQLI